MLSATSVTAPSQHALIAKYDVPTPRYTSYPTVPHWDEAGITHENWLKHVKNAFSHSNISTGISLYIHLPFCEKLCTYCGCNKRITVNHAVESPYLTAVLKEWKMYLNLFEEKPVIRELHLGGGTPTFFSAQNLAFLIDGIFAEAEVAPNPEFSLEVHPNYTRRDQLEALYARGFRRLSVGVQDFDPKVQLVINRIQTFEQTKRVFDEAREIGYTSINADIIYGLPLQTKASVQNTIEKVRELMPERIAFYSYAHVPWKSKSQRRYTEADLPAREEKRALYELGRDLLEQTGYREIGMDHFALPTDSLFLASADGTLHRNFMGYTTRHTDLMIGLGCSSISDTWTAFAQNIKDVTEYEQAIERGEWPIFKGHELTEEDLMLRQHILNLMCRYQTAVSAENYTPYLDLALENMDEVLSDGLVEIKDGKVQVTEAGKPFLRNICGCLDARLSRTVSEQPLFSKSI